MRLRTCLFAVLLAVAFGGYAFGGAERVVPAGHEAMLAQELTPPAGLLPAGVTLDQIQVLGESIRLVFRQTDEPPARFLLRLREFIQDVADTCHLIGPLALCPEDTEAPVWLALYVAHLTGGPRGEILASAWSKEVVLPPPPPPVSHVEPVTEYVGNLGKDDVQTGCLAVLIALFSLVLGVALWSVRAGMRQGIRGVLAPLRRIGGTLRDGLARWQKDPTWQFLTWLLVLAVVFVVRASPPIMAHTCTGWFDDPGLRGSAVNLYFAGLLLAILVAFLRIGLRRPRHILPIIYGVGLGVLIAAVASSSLLLYLDDVNPRTVWLELHGGAELARDGTIPYMRSHFHGADFIVSLFFRLWGIVPDAVNLLRYVSLLVFGGGLVYLATVVNRSYLAGVLAAALAVLSPVLAEIFLKGWWFFLGNGLILATLATFILAGRRSSRGLLLLALLLAQLALEVRLEAVLLWPLYYALRRVYAFPTPRINALITLLFIVNLIRIAFLPASSLADTGTLQRLGTYLGMFWQVPQAPLLPALALGGLILSLLNRSRTSPVIVLLLLGVVPFYSLVGTTPSVREFLLIEAILLVGASGLATAPGWKQPVLGFVLRILMILVVLGSAYSLWADSTRFQLDAKHALLKSGDGFVSLVNGVPPDTPILIDPLLYAVSLPGRVPLLQRQSGELTLTGLKALVADYPEIVCISRLGEGDICNYLELFLDDPLFPSRMDCPIDGGCFPTAAFERQVELLAQSGPFRAWKLFRDTP